MFLCFRLFGMRCEGWGWSFYWCLILILIWGAVVGLILLGVFVAGFGVWVA